MSKRMLQVVGVVSVLSIALVSCMIAKSPKSKMKDSPIKSIIPDRVIGNLKFLPKVDNENLNRIFKDQETYWYDKISLPHVYQDSVSTVFGVRYNTAALNASRIAQGDRVFTPEGFFFPFAHALGTDNAKDLYLLNFLSLPTVNGARLNVVYWEEANTRWRWLFPVGTVVGEIMMIKAPAGMPQEYYTVEVRTRTRYQEGWEPDVFRPFGTAQELDVAITKKRPDWEKNAALKQLIAHLRTKDSLKPASRAPTQYYAKTIDPLQGLLDVLPDFGDDKLVGELLTETAFYSMEGRIWKGSDGVETYAASTESNFSIVPYKFEAGLAPVHEISCNRCHEDTGRQVGEFNFDTQLYGEVWGEDRIFTWHLFDENKDRSGLGLNGPYDNNRRLNRELAAAGLVVRYNKSIHTEQYYTELKRRYQIKFF